MRDLSVTISSLIITNKPRVQRKYRDAHLLWRNETADTFSWEARKKGKEWNIISTSVPKEDAAQGRKTIPSQARARQTPQVNTHSWLGFEGIQ